MPSTAVALFADDDAAFNTWASQLARDIDATLHDYEIADPAARQTLLLARLRIDLLAGRNQQALASIAAIRALEPKVALRPTVALREEVIARARLLSGASSGPAFDAQVERTMRATLAALPASGVTSALQSIRASFEANVPAVLRALVETQIDDELRRTGSLSWDAAELLSRARFFATVQFPARAAAIPPLRQAIAQRTTLRPNIWPDREVTLTAGSALSPVTVAIWDTGVDVSLFPGQVVTGTTGVQRGPGNGHGLSFDAFEMPTTGVLRPLSAAQQAGYAAALDDLQGDIDARADLDTPAAVSYRAKIAALDDAAARTYFAQQSQVADYIHGTHVAGIAVRGNPAARIAVIRHVTWDPDPPPVPSDAWVDGVVAEYADISRWLQANRVRVVNMSFLFTPSGYEAGLERSQAPLDEHARRALARRLFERRSDAFVKVITDNPDTVFVAGAGNSNGDNEFEETIPSSLVLPNLVVVGGVDQAGEEMTMSSFGRNVALAARGFQVASVVPGGRTLALTGTSMAAPQVANLAAKLFALKPDLTARQAIHLMTAGATPSADGRLHLIDPKASVALLKAAQY